MARNLPRRRLPGFFDDQNPEEIELVIPDDLTELTDEDVQALHDQTVEAFNGLYGDGESLTDEDFEALSELTRGVERLRSELTSRAQAREEQVARATELASRVNGESEPEPQEDDEDEPVAAEEENPEGETEEEETAPEPEPVLASNRPIRVNLSGLRSRQSAPARRVAQPQRMQDLVSAAPDLPGFSNGQGMTWEDIGRAVDARLRGFNETQYRNARLAGREMRQQFGVAVVRRPFEDGLMVQSNDPGHVDEVIRRAVDESRLPGGSLVAAGGWCAPSQVIYDLLEMESRDGLFSLPEIGITRGGIQFTPGPDFASIYNSVGFTYSEAQDEAGSYSGGTNEVQSVSITGSPTGGTFTLTFNGETTQPIPYNATASQVIAAISALSSVPGSGLAGGGGPLPGTPVTVTFGGLLGGLDQPQMTADGSELTGGTDPAVAVSTSTPGVAGSGDKPCYTVPCPDFQERRLNLSGVCLSAGLLQQRGYPEVIARTTRGALIAHDHKVSAAVLNAVVTGSTPVTMTADQVGTTAPLLDAIEMQVEHYRYIHRMARRTTLEAVFPFWVYGAIRSDLARRQGVDLIDVPDSRINAWFTTRGVSAQFVYNWQDLTGAAGSFTAWPSSVSFLLYAAGTWVRGNSDIVSLDTIYDSVNLGQNDYTALFTEEGWLVAKVGHDSRVVTVPVCSTGGTHGGVTIDCDGTDADAEA